MVDEFYIKRGDTRPSIGGYCRDSLGNPVSLSGASVKFNMYIKGSAPKVNASATIADQNSGRVRYDWSAEDTDTAGTYYAEFQVTFSSGKIETYPNDSFIIIHITEDVAN